ncbi:MAG TPA: HAD family phosphatase [Puia sp.]|uniref:HAD family hydrolase n=1 Tax=Puia sp. TaxID=2045100 RepID=UPI002CD10D59|nr:HAD family phosphatase [Puia sp.]HVU97342.1 HAD family phosphatase [Puia sp.]
MRGIKNIIFDLGGVIINLDNQRTTDAFVALGLKNIREYFGHGHAASFFKDYEVGRITDREFIDAIRETGGLTASDQAIIDGWNALLLDFPRERIALLKQLQKTYRIFLFSNTNALHLAALQGIYTRTFGSGSLEDLFERTYYSHLLGMRKPDKASYEYILRENGLEGQETLFVDDAIINVEGAEQAGLKGLFLRPGISLLDFQW